MNLQIIINIFLKISNFKLKLGKHLILYKCLHKIIYIVDFI